MIEDDEYICISLTLRQHPNKPYSWACMLGKKLSPDSFEAIWNMVAGIGPTPQAAFDNAVQLVQDYNHRVEFERQVREADMRRSAEARRFAETFSADDIDLSKLGDVI
jgi:hypothetical protein